MDMVEWRFKYQIDEITNGFLLTVQMDSNEKQSVHKTEFGAGRAVKKYALEYYKDKLEMWEGE